MGTPNARNVAPVGSEYAETVRSNHCNFLFSLRKETGCGFLSVGPPPYTPTNCLKVFAAAPLEGRPLQ
ncbi:hypothetical protein TNCV_5056501 [Trichonephila clavipes]|nr:hypothetical protein TNCV_5056501 [Trichonephila clavipes]